MTTAECYALIGADYTEVLRRMGNEDRVRRFLLKFAEEPSYGLLCRSVEAGDAKEAFRAAHSIKGVCLNLGLTALYRSAGDLCEELRGGAFTDAVPGLLRRVGEDYQKTNDALVELMDTLAESCTEAEYQRLEEIFVNCSRYELGFWEMAWTLER